MYDVWHVLANDDAEQRQASRTAVAMANKRVKDKFGRFLASDTEARFELVKDEIEALVTATAEEYGADPTPILAGILASVTPEKQIEPRIAAVVEARRPKMCPYHSEVVDASLAAGDPRAGFDAFAQHAWGPKHCKGDEYDGGKCNFKREFTTQSYWDEKKEQAEQRRQEREEQQAEQAEELPVVDEITEDEPELIEETPVEEPVEDNVVEVDFGGEVDEPSAVGEGAGEELAVAASHDQDAPLEGRTADVREEQLADLRAQLARAEAELANPGRPRDVAGSDVNAKRDSAQRRIDRLRAAIERVESRAAKTADLRKEAPGSEHLPAASPKRNRQYEHIKDSCLEGGKSEEECKELAARTVNKQRAEHGETKDSKTAGPYDGPNSVNNQLADEFGYHDYPDYDERAQAEQPCVGCGFPHPGGQCPNCGLANDGLPGGLPVDYPEYEPGDLRGQDMYSKTTIAEALETVDVTKNTHPDFDRSRDPGERPDTEMEGSPHPTVTVDPTEPIVYENDATPFEGTNAVSEKQDVTKADAAQKGKGGTFPKGTGTDPVTSSLLKEALTARDFVAIAHILATSPGGPDPQLAEHFANYLANTNPAFDRERFLAAAGGTPSTGRDNYRDQYGPVAAVADVNTNPVREILLEQAEDGFLGEDEVLAAVAKRR